MSYRWRWDGQMDVRMDIAIFVMKSNKVHEDF